MLFSLNFWVDARVSNLTCLQFKLELGIKLIFRSEVLYQVLFLLILTQEIIYFVPEHKDGQFFQKISSPCRKKVSHIMIVNAYNALKWGKRILSLQFIFVA